MSRVRLDYCEFYITNVCNLTCVSCNRFNNYIVKGRVEFDYDLYKPWADNIEFGHIGIIGGEPLLHPNLKTWVEGIHSLWPDTRILVTSNGTRLNFHKGLFDFMIANNAVLEISFHEEEIDSYLHEQISIFKDMYGTNWEEENSTYSMYDRDGKEVSIPTRTVSCDEGFVFEFTDAHHFQRVQFDEAQHKTGNPQPTIGDPKQAHYVCGMKNSHTFYDGKLYKCGFIPSVMQYLNQYGVDSGWEKVYEYIPHIDLSDIDRIKKPEDVCSLCPQNYLFDKVKTDFK